MGHPGPCRILRVKGQAKPQPHVWRLWRVPWGPEQGGDKADPLSETWARTPTHLFTLPSTTPRFFSPADPSSELWASAQLPTQPLLTGTQVSASRLLRSTGGHPCHLFLSPTPFQTHQKEPGPSQATFRIPPPVSPLPASALVQAPSLLTQVFLFTALRPPEVSFQLREKARVPQASF